MLNRKARPVRITVPAEIAAEAGAAHAAYLAAVSRRVPRADVAAQEAGRAELATTERRLAAAYSRLAEHLGWAPLLGAAATAAEVHTEQARRLQSIALPAGSGVAS
ncbi:hypothetical protein [Saccharopolyspora sp. 6V]|uniref:hypothetical protein n=1 Tax=Saccharopolyspora sp. 6V TaxID=2877239 RepID=UPI001CD2D249|nr:hypothetical protein [Saccharopolyspora sp. 6V]MCA1194171.1 hypothetical protein [Saccharopolyspora sp. 6V]